MRGLDMTLILMVKFCGHFAVEMVTISSSEDEGESGAQSSSKGNGSEMTPRVGESPSTSRSSSPATQPTATAKPRLVSRLQKMEDEVLCKVTLELNKTTF